MTLSGIDARTLLLGAGLALAMVSAVTALALVGRARRESRLTARLHSLRRGTVLSAARPPDTVANLLRAVGDAVVASGVVGARTLGELEMTVAAAGYRGGRAVAAFLGGKVLLLVLLPLLALPLTSGLDGLVRNLTLALAAAVGLLAPDMVLRNLRKTHRKAVDRGLPDALDLLVICAEAGLALEAGVERVAVEMREANPALAAEFATTATELRMLPDRRQALINLGLRTGIEAARRLGGTLAQTLQYGTPLTQALRVLSTEMRADTLNRFEARAARLPVLLTLPTIGFILPCIFLVVGGPAAVQLLDSLR